MIQVEQLHKRFGEVIAVDEVSFEATDGAVTGLLGPNGAGKTTVLRMLCGLITPDRGRVLIDDIEVAAQPLQARQRIGVLPDAKGLYPRLTAREHMRYFGQLHGLKGEGLEQRIDHLVDLLDMGSVVDRRVSGFSQGERLKVALGRALVHNPKNLVLDEPTNGLDVMSTRAMRQLIRRLRQEGICVLFSSHIMQEVAALCDFIAIVAEGRLAASGTPDQLRAQTGLSNLEDVFVRLSGIDEVQP